MKNKNMTGCIEWSEQSPMGNLENEDGPLCLIVMENVLIFSAMVTKKMDLALIASGRTGKRRRCLGQIKFALIVVVERVLWLKWCRQRQTPTLDQLKMRRWLRTRSRSKAVVIRSCGSDRLRHSLHVYIYNNIHDIIIRQTPWIYISDAPNFLLQVLLRVTK